MYLPFSVGPGDGCVCSQTGDRGSKAEKNGEKNGEKRTERRHTITATSVIPYDLIFKE
jgi:hypothetical protein